MRILVCGGAGFIGSHFVEHALSKGDKVSVLDALTYAGREENLAAVRDDIRFHVGDIARQGPAILAARGCDVIVNFAAETHVDRSIEDSAVFTRTNVIGTHNLLELARQRRIRYLQISTDEVYGSIEEGSFTEDSPYAPSSPYSASKAGADLLVQSYRRTYGLDALIVRGSNNYGPRQFPEKLIPLATLAALAGVPIPVYGDGLQVRNWIHVSDFVRGVYHVLAHGAPGAAYNCGGADESTNLNVVSLIQFDTGHISKIAWVKDRLGHDRRYSLDSSTLRELGWAPKVPFREGIKSTVNWYRDNESWWAPLR